MTVLSAVVLLLVAGSVVFCALAIAAARSYLSARPPALQRPVPISILRPLAGQDEGLEENLRSCFRQDYPEFEILFAVRRASDPAAAAAAKLQREFPGVHSRLIVTGDPPYPNAKVFALDHMVREARHPLLVMADSDTRAAPDMLRVIAAEFQDPRLGIATCPYRAVPGRSLWSALEAIYMNTEFLAGVLTARMLEGMKFAVGPCVAARREALDRIGGIASLKEHLAEDFVLGSRVSQAGYGNILSSCVIEHRIGTQSFAPNFEHRLRWARSTRRSRPWGYIGQVFTYPLPAALLLAAVRPGWWPLAALAVAARMAAAWATAGWALHDGYTGRHWWLVPLQDLASFAVWLAGFFGRTVRWRDRRYYLHPDGRFELREASRQKSLPPG